MDAREAALPVVLMMARRDEGQARYEENKRARVPSQACFFSGVLDLDRDDAGEFVYTFDLIFLFLYGVLFQRQLYDYFFRIIRGIVSCVIDFKPILYFFSYF